MARRKLNRKLKHPRILITLVVCLALLSGALFLYASRTTDIDRFRMTLLESLDETVIEEQIQTDFKESYTVQDYGIYGETLSFYSDRYSQESYTSLVGQMVVLRNVETQEELSFAFGENVDSGIRLNHLEPGLYEIYIYDNYDKKRLCFKKPVESETFSTIRNQKHVKNIRLVADSTYLEEYGRKMDKNYAFLEVMENIPQVKVADIVLDPGGQIYNEATMTTEAGIVNDWINEPQLTLEFANLLKTKLEEKGLRVLLTREDDQGASYYGTSSRVGIGYQAQAKAFISFEAYEDDTLTRPYLLTSRFTTGLLANEIAYELAGSDLELASVSSNGSFAAGITNDAGMIDDQEEDFVYDAYPALRETGGKQTFAGDLSFAQANESYKNSFGMESVVFFLANGDNEESVQYFQDHQEEMADSIVNAICSYYGIQGEESETSSQ